MTQYTHATEENRTRSHRSPRFAPIWRPAPLLGRFLP